jgi:predicted cupin superfamily sugar epimerase
MINSIDHIIKELKLEPHPEGGYFKETYRSLGTINDENLEAGYEGKRNYSTCIYFLLTSDNFSAFHRIKQDEIWHFYDGSPIRLHILTALGIHSVHIIGRDFKNGETPQIVVPGGCWFAAEVINKNSYSLVGCTVSPGFNFKDFELKSRQELVSLFPDKEELISKLTHH